MMTEVLGGKLGDLAVDAIKSVVSSATFYRRRKEAFVNAGQFGREYEKTANQVFYDLQKALSDQNMVELAQKLSSENGYELREKLHSYLLSLLREYEIPEDVVLLYAREITQEIIEKVASAAPDKFDRCYLSEWRQEEKDFLQNLLTKIEKVETALVMCNERKMKVYSANTFDVELKRKTENPRIGIDFFEIDDDDFKTAFSSKLHDNKICVRGRFIEETIGCVLNELWRLRDPRPVFIVQSEDDWEKLSKVGQAGNIYIPNFIADEIVPIEHNTNIFTYTEGIPAFSNDIIDLRPRTYETLVKCLVRAGMEANQADALVEETHGLYVAMKKKLFRGQLPKMPRWVSGLSERIKQTCLLLGQWTECEGDVAVVEELSGMNYADFISQLMPFTRGEDPLIHIITRRGEKSYYLSSVENTWEYYQVSVSDKVWEHFAALLHDVMTEYEKIFTYAPRDLMVAQYAGETHFWSSTIRNGMLKTLLIKAGYKGHEECQNQLDKIIENMMSSVDDTEKWKYISNFFGEICEIAPEVILTRLDEELDHSTGLMELFQNQDPDFIMGKNHYISILFGIEEFLLQREFAEEAYIWLLRLDNRGYTYTSNSPADVFLKVLCPWHNFSVFYSPDEKIRLAEEAFKYSQNAWKIVYKNLPESHQVIAGTLHAPKYRKPMQNSDVTYADLSSVVDGYIHVLVQHAEFRPERWIKLIKYSSDVDNEMRKGIIESFLEESIQMDDLEKIQVKDAIRQLIYEHRYYVSASWAMSEDEVMMYEQLLDKIHSVRPEYEFLYLFNPNDESLLLYPVHDDTENSTSSNEKAKEQLLKEKIIDFKEKRYDLALLSRLCSSIEFSALGRVLAKYWNGEQFDPEVFTILLEAQTSGDMAVDYYNGFSTETPKWFQTVMDIALNHKAEVSMITKLYRVEATFSYDIPQIAGAEEAVKREFWKDEFSCLQYDWNWCINECKKYGTLNSYIVLLYVAFEKHHISEETLYHAFDDIEKLKLSQHRGDLFQHCLKTLIKALQQAYMDDAGKCTRIAGIELIFFQYLDWKNMKCFKKSMNQDPKVLTDLIDIVFKKDHQKSVDLPEEIRDKISALYSLYHKIEFCPTEIDGEIKKEELELWIKKFNDNLQANDQASLFDRLLGRLFAFSPAGQDDHMPCEAVRDMIEEYSDQRMQREYCLTIYNKRGVHALSAGRGEKKLAEQFKENAEYLSLNGYPKTAEIYYMLARSYTAEARREREEAENGRF